MKQFLIILQVLLCWAFTTNAQTITGTVSDANGPLSAASVVEKGIKTNGTITDENGNFKLALKGTSRTLTVSSVGHATQDVKVGNQTNINIILQPDEQGLNAVVVVGYGTKKRVTNTGAVSAISGDAIRRVPTSSVQNTLQGKLPGFFSVQRGGQPGRDASDFFIRGVSSLNPDGNKPLIIVDDIQYTYEQLAQINVNEIESISILKDASTTAVYGIKGANGVLIVKTRRGASGIPQVNVRVEAGANSPTRKPKFLNAYQSATLVNEALRNDGLQPQFSQYELDMYQSHQQPYLYPDVNWYDVVFKDFSMQANTNVDISGGTDNVKYFISAGAFTQNGNLHHFADARNESVNNQYFYHRYNFRSNLDIQATKSLKLRFDVSGRFGQINNPLVYSNTTATSIMSEIYNYGIITPFAAPVLNPDGSYAYAFGPNLTNVPTINARLATMGYTRNSRTDFNTLFDATQRLDFITKGLSVQVRFAYAGTNDITRTQSRRYTPPAYHYDSSGTYTLDKNGKYNLAPFALSGSNDLYDRRINIQGFINYDRTLGSNHFYALGLFNQENYTTKVFGAYRLDVPQKLRGYTLKLGYDYKSKYLVDFNAGYNGSDRFGSGHRYGFFPAGSIGWNLAGEDFFKNAFPMFQLFKIRASYGLVGSDAVVDNRYLYQQIYARGGYYFFGTTANTVQGLYEGSLGNSNVTWEKSRKKDLGLDINMLQDKLSITADYFNEYRYDQLFYPGSIPNIIGVGFARENLASVRNHGYEGSIRFQSKIGNVGYDITGVFSYAKNKIVYEDEPSPAYPWLARTGHPINQPFGYTAIGFYESEEDIEKSPKPNIDPSAIKPGDLKYADLNGDGVIDERDQGPIGKPNIPNTSAGVTFGVHYKGLDVSILFQGAFNYSFAIQGIGIQPFQSQWQPIHELRWTAENAANAKFPRLSSSASYESSPTAYPSSFWLINAMYVRMKTVEIGYQFPKQALPFKINSARLYFSGYNLFTWTNFKLYQQDPEVASNTAGDAYLNQRVMNIGLQVGF
ncbi:TonB-dependent receptor [Ilyomonas limi]|uniref:TonB-dependent receptor n=1 Tax=Ilyomonas limi TaxID=2575867 RepID=A0A4U3L185_9BACT|nr:TonB-dependent receptor [Ilyomonas limi]TKK67954.1 TonB-dependent receptor [Ilyomonas limi]